MLAHSLTTLCYHTLNIPWIGHPPDTTSHTLYLDANTGIKPSLAVTSTSPPVTSSSEHV